MPKKIERREISTEIWVPEALHFGQILNSNDLKYAIFGAGALAAHNVMIRPTVDIDFVVADYDKAIAIMTEQPKIKSTNLENERDGIQVADFHFESGITVQIWNNNLYSLPMTNESWSRTTLIPIGNNSPIYSVSKEDIIVSKIGRHTQQSSMSSYSVT